MNLKQKMRYGTIVNICFFVLALLFLLSNLSQGPIIATQISLTEHVVIVISMMSIIAVLVALTVFIPGRLITTSTLFITLPRISFNKSNMSLFNGIITYKKTIHKLHCVYRY